MEAAFPSPWDEISRNRAAFWAAALSTAALAGTALVWIAGAPAHLADDEVLFTVDFTPAEIMALGVADAPALTPAASAAPPEPEPILDPPPTTVSADAAEPSPPDADRPQPDPKPRPRPVVKPGPRPLPGPPSKGDPFGNPGGFSDLTRAGEPWATGVLRALQGVELGVFGKPVQAGTMQFTISVCADGSVGAIRRKGGSLPADLQRDLAATIARVRLPRPPRAVAAQMKGRCAKIRHTFVWSADTVD